MRFYSSKISKECPVAYRCHNFIAVKCISNADSFGWHYLYKDGSGGCKPYPPDGDEILESIYPGEKITIEL